MVESDFISNANDGKLVDLKLSNSALNNIILTVRSNQHAPSTKPLQFNLHNFTNYYKSFFDCSSYHVYSCMHDDYHQFNLSLDACQYIKNMRGKNINDDQEFLNFNNNTPDRLTSNLLLDGSKTNQNDHIRQIEYDLRQKFNKQLELHDTEYAHKFKIISIFLDIEGDLNDMVNDQLDGKPNDNIELLKKRKQSLTDIQYYKDKGEDYKKKIELEYKKRNNLFAQNSELINQESHNKSLLRKEIHDLKEILAKKEKEYQVNLNLQKKVRDDDMINIIENSSTSVNKSAIVSQALTALKDEFKKQVLDNNKDVNLI